MTVYVCAEKDIECGDRPDSWCIGCPKRARRLTPQEAQWVHDAVRRSSTLAAPGKLVMQEAGAMKQADEGCAVHGLAHPCETCADESHCWCRTCRPLGRDRMEMVLCPDCGNKRCPKANNHRYGCTNSNDLGQPGSAYSDIPHPLAANEGTLTAGKQGGDGVPAVAPAEFKLQVGKTYLDRNGRRVTILERFADVMYSYCGDNGIKYLEHGFQFDGRPGYNESDEDLLVEAPAGVGGDEK